MAILVTKMVTRGFSGTRISFLALIFIGDVTVTDSLTDTDFKGLKKAKIQRFWAQKQVLGGFRVRGFHFWHLFLSATSP